MDTEAMELAIYLHRTQPWVPNFKRVLLRPNTRITCGLLADDVRVGTKIMYEPSEEFWRQHVMMCHNGGPGCDVDKHVNYLTSEGNPGFYEYGVQLTDLSYHKITLDGFTRECNWWRQNFPRLLEYAKRTRPNLNRSVFI